VSLTFVLVFVLVFVSDAVPPSALRSWSETPTPVVPPVRDSDIGGT
jgi:hypothetical protein